MTATAADVTAALERLGDTRDEVAAALLGLGHSGCVSGVGGNCPIHNYLAECFPGVVAVGTGYVTVAGVGEVALPAPVSDFVVGFDMLSYPELAERPFGDRVAS